MRENARRARADSVDNDSPVANSVIRARTERAIRNLAFAANAAPDVEAEDAEAVRGAAGKDGRWTAGFSRRWDGVAPSRMAATSPGMERRGASCRALLRPSPQCRGSRQKGLATDDGCPPSPTTASAERRCFKETVTVTDETETTPRAQAMAMGTTRRAAGTRKASTAGRKPAAKKAAAAKKPAARKAAPKKAAAAKKPAARKAAPKKAAAAKKPAAR
ncbi:MAG: hypothetical protein NZM27_07285, partial [Acetobacteraceae bacterium]|nr:hypothetical protein [Acetobacteraceae bacterium]